MDRKTLSREYRETPRPMGLFAVRNTTEDVLLIGITPDLPGILNRQRFQLEMGSHPDKSLQADWDRLGPDAFTFEVLDELEPSAEAGQEPSEELATFREMWLAKLESSGQALYPMATRGR